jgi:hypothetical protein
MRSIVERRRRICLPHVLQARPGMRTSQIYSFSSIIGEVYRIRGMSPQRSRSNSYLGCKDTGEEPENRASCAIHSGNVNRTLTLEMAHHRRNQIVRERTQEHADVTGSQLALLFATIPLARHSPPGGLRRLPVDLEQDLAPIFVNEDQCSVYTSRDYAVTVRTRSLVTSVVRRATQRRSHVPSHTSKPRVAHQSGAYLAGIN